MKIKILHGEQCLIGAYQCDECRRSNLKTVYTCCDHSIGLCFIALTKELAEQWCDIEKGRFYNTEILATKLSDIVDEDGNENYIPNEK